MANWKKVVVSGSAAEFSTLKVDNLTSGVVTGSGSTLGTQAINGTGNILATTGATGVSASGSFSGSFYGDGTNLTGVVASAPNSLHFEGGLIGADYNGSSAVTASISGAASLSTNNITKWTGTGFANSSLTDNGTAITGTTSIQLSGANSSLSGSFSGSFSGLADRAVSSSYANNASTADLALTANTASYVAGGNVVGTVASATSASYASNASTADSATTAVTANTASYVAGGNVVGTVASATSASYATFAQSAASGNGSFSGSFSGSFQGDGSGLTGIAATLFVSGGTGNGQVDLKTQTLSIVGTANEVETSVSGQTVTIGLPNNVTVNGDLTVQNNLTVFGTASFQQTTNLEVADRFVLFASGSNATGDGGIVVQQATQNVGELFGYDSSTVRWGVTSSFSADAGTFTPDAFMAVASIGVGTDPTAIDARYQAKGNIFIGTDEGIWIYS